MGGVMTRDTNHPPLPLADDDQDAKHKPVYYDLPLDPLLIHIHYDGETRLKQLQRSLTAQVEDFFLQAVLVVTKLIRFVSMRAGKAKVAGSPHAIPTSYAIDTPMSLSVYGLGLTLYQMSTSPLARSA